MYDRAGEGWSDPGPFPRTSAAIANDLHEFLKRTGVAPPYVLAGASFGGLNSRVYHGLFPHDVAGMVLSDSAHEDEPRRAPKFYLARTAPRYLWYPLHVALQTAARLGLLPSPRFPCRGMPRPVRGTEPLGRSASNPSRLQAIWSRAWYCPKATRKPQPTPPVRE